MLFTNPVQLSFYAGLIILQSGASSYYSATTVGRGTTTLEGLNSKQQRDVVEESDTFLERLRALWKSSGGNRQSEEESSFDSQSEESRVNKAIIKWRNRINSIRGDGDTLPGRPSHRFEYRQLKVPVRLGLVRFSPRKPTALPKLNSASSFPVLMPSDPSWPNNYTVTTSDLYRVTGKAYLRQATINKRGQRSDYYPESLPHESDASIRDDPLEQMEDHKDGSRWSDYFSGPEVAHDVCPSVSDWVARSEALDPYGNRLTVLQRIPVNGTVVNQYFFETYCASSGLEGLDSSHSAYYSARTLIECRGINKNVWNSRCKENFIWTYGKVITVSGDVGWSVIAIRGSCGCAIWRKPEEVIGRRRRLLRKPIRQG